MTILHGRQNALTSGRHICNADYNRGCSRGLCGRDPKRSRISSSLVSLDMRHKSPHTCEARAPEKRGPQYCHRCRRRPDMDDQLKTLLPALKDDPVDMGCDYPQQSRPPAAKLLLDIYWSPRPRP